jgi:MFS family permease
VFAGTLVNRLGGFVEPFLVLYLAHRGLSTATIGGYAALVGLGGMISQPLGGVLADRIGRRETFAIGMVGAAASFALLGGARAPWLLAVGGFFAGLFIDVYRPASAAIVADVVDPADRVRAYGLIYWVLNAGFAVAAAVAGVLATAGYGLLFAADALTCLAFAAIVWRFVPGDTRPPHHEHDARGGLAQTLADRTLLAFAALTCMQALVYAQAFSTLPLAMRRDGHGPATYGAVIALNGVMIVLVQPLLLPRLARLARPRVLAGGCLLLAAGFGLEGLTAATLAYALPLLVWTLGEILLSAVGPAVIADLAPAHLRGRYQGVFGLAFGIAFMAGPAVGALLLSGAGARTLFTACAAAAAAAAAGFVALGPRLRARGAA